jgi:hypothetical protein
VYPEVDPHFAKEDSAALQTHTATSSFLVARYHYRITCHMLYNTINKNSFRIRKKVNMKIGKIFTGSLISRDRCVPKNRQV